MVPLFPSIKEFPGTYLQAGSSKTKCYLWQIQFDREEGEELSHNCKYPRNIPGRGSVCSGDGKDWLYAKKNRRLGWQEWVKHMNIKIIKATKF